MQMPAFLANLTEAQWASIRYGITALGVLLAAFGVVDQTIFDQIVGALIALATAVWGVLQTDKLEGERDTAVALRDLAVTDLRLARLASKNEAGAA